MLILSKNEAKIWSA